MENQVVKVICINDQCKKWLNQKEVVNNQCGYCQTFQRLNTVPDTEHQIANGISIKDMFKRPTNVTFSADEYTISDRKVCLKFGNPSLNFEGTDELIFEQEGKTYTYKKVKLVEGCI